MPLYEYQAYNSQGKKSSGLIDAPSRALAFERVRQQGLFPAAIQEETDDGSQGHSKPENVAFALIQLATLIRAGLPLPQAIDALVSQVPDRALQRGLARMRVRLQEGTSFANALAETPVFGTLLPKLVAAGENVGSLDVLLEEYAHFVERGQEFRQKVAGAMIYPAVILTASMGLMFFVMTKVTPTLLKVYSSFRIKMPLPTQILMGVGAFMQAAWPWVLIGLVAGVFILRRGVSARTRDTWLLKVPVVGTVHMWTQVSRWSRTMALLHKGGVPLVRALHSARDVVESPVLAESLDVVEKAVERGEGLGMALRKGGLMPPLVGQMVETGEKSGELASLLVAAATFFEKEADRTLQVFIRLLEPAMILVMGGVVGFVVLSILLPIFEINRMIH